MLERWTDIGGRWKEIIDLVPEIEVRAADRSGRSPQVEASFPTSTIGTLSRRSFHSSRVSAIGIGSCGSGRCGASRPGEMFLITTPHLVLFEVLLTRCVHAL